MLERANRLVRGDDFRKVMRGGKKTSSQHLVSYQIIEADQSIRFGFVVSKACGKAVSRNQLKRRLRSLARHRMNQMSQGSQVVIRTLPGSEKLAFSSLEAEFDQVFGIK